ncbi:tail fiber assembly protein [Serratia marcescens]|nr:tail fiber assembly protein [Serratia marcescens]
MITIVTSPRDARYSSADNSTIDCIIGVHLAAGSESVTEIPFTASPEDTEEHGRQLYADLVAGEFGVVAPYLPPEIPLEQLRERALSKRSRLLADADAVIRPLERAVKLGIATEEEKARLDAWERYSVLLSRVDTDKAPDIAWPTYPAEPSPIPPIAKSQRKKK